MFRTRWTRRALFLFAAFFLLHVLEVEAYARAGGGRSFGSRGSRSYSPPRSYSAPTKPSSPSQPQRQPYGQPAPQTGNPFWRGLAGGMIGGMLGGLLFSTLGFGAGHGGWGQGGIGLFDILLIGLILYGIYWFVKKRRQAAAATSSYQSMRVEAAEPAPSTSYSPAYSDEADGGSDLEKGLSHIRQMDPYFDEGKFREECTDLFFKVQGAWANRDMSSVRSLVTEEVLQALQADADKLRSERRINRLENIAVRSVEIVEAWQESGSDFITVRFTANLLDYTVEETTGKVVSGSKVDPVKFEEYWTFTRSVGNRPWRLCAIQQA